MKTQVALKTLTLAAVLALPVAASAETQTGMPGREYAASIQGTSTIEKIDAKTREVTLKRQDGSVVTIVAGDEVRNFAQMKVGDIVETEIVKAVAVTLEPAHTQVRERHDQYSGYRALPGEKPGAKTIHTVEVIGTVEAIDTKARQATIKGAKQTVTLSVADDVDLSKVKVGDNVHVGYIESVSIQVKAPTK